MKRNGRTFPPMNRNTFGRLFALCIRNGDCWEFVGYRNWGGYGQFDKVAVHRLSYRWFVGDIPDGLQIDHLCRNRACFNPAHLEVVTAAENQRRARNAAVLCQNGLHPKKKDGEVTCKPCHSLRQQAYIKRKRAVAI